MTGRRLVSLLFKSRKLTVKTVITPVVYPSPVRSSYRLTRKDIPACCFNRWFNALTWTGQTDERGGCLLSFVRYSVRPSSLFQSCTHNRYKRAVDAHCKFVGTERAMSTRKGEKAIVGKQKRFSITLLYNRFCGLFENPK